MVQWACALVTGLCKPQHYHYLVWDKLLSLSESQFPNLCGEMGILTQSVSQSGDKRDYEYGNTLWTVKSYESWWDCLKVLAAQLCLTFCDPMDCSPPGSSVHGILLARILEWVAISFSRVSSRPWDRTRLSHIAGRLFTDWATREAQFCCFTSFLCSQVASSLKGWKVAMNSPEGCSALRLGALKKGLRVYSKPKSHLLFEVIGRFPKRQIPRKMCPVAWPRVLLQ